MPTSPSFSDPKPVLAPDAGGSGGASAEGLTRVLAPLVADRRLGAAAVSVVDVETGKPLYSLRATELVTPASTTKIVTAAAVLGAVGPYHRFTTKVLAGASPGEVVLVGGGDPTLTAGPRGSYPGAARLDELAKRVKAAGPVSKVVFDASLFDGPAAGPGWDGDTISGGYSAPISALMVDGGRLVPLPAASSPQGRRATDPARFAARAFAKLLGVPASTVVPGKAADGAREIARLDSPPVQHLVELMLQLSDNTLAESLLRQVAIARQQPATFQGGSAAVKVVLGGLGVDMAGDALVDGSGLSRLDKLTPQLLTSVLQATADDRHPELRGVLAGLPVAAFSGTLTKRFGAPQGKAGAGEVRAKTGTLTGISALSGVVVADNGQQLAFAAVANGVPAGGRFPAEAALDRIAASLASCGCT